MYFTPSKPVKIKANKTIGATVLQYYIYKTNPCGKHANTCVDADGNPLVSPINIGVSYFAITQL